MTFQSEKKQVSRPLEGEFLATAVWASYLLARFKVQSPFAMQKAVDASLGRDFVYQSDQWPDYIAGARRSRPTLTALLGKKHPRSVELRMHIFWKQVKTSGNTPTPAMVLKAVNGKVSDIAAQITACKPPYKGDHYPLAELTKMASLDALACQLALLKKYSRRSKSGPSEEVQKRVKRITLAAYKTMLILCTQPEFNDFRVRIYELVNELHFVPASEITGCVLQLRRPFGELVDILSNGALMERFDWDGSKRETALHMFQLIQGRYRWDFPIALCPLMVPKGMSQDGAGMKTPADLIMESWAFKSVKYPYLLPFPRDIPIPGDEGLS